MWWEHFTLWTLQGDFSISYVKVYLLIRMWCGHCYAVCPLGTKKLYFNEVGKLFKGHFLPPVFEPLRETVQCSAWNVNLLTFKWSSLSVPQLFINWELQRPFWFQQLIIIISGWNSDQGVASWLLVWSATLVKISDRASRVNLPTFQQNLSCL